MIEHATDRPSGLNTATRLALERTRLAYERTMMAWVKTSTSLITFGFSVYKFFELETAGKDMGPRLIGSREFALVLISIGLLSLVAGTLEHRRDLKSMRQEYPGMPRSATGVIAVLIAVLGLFALLAVALRG